MERKEFKTLIKGDDNLGQNNYVIGRISGVMLGLITVIDNSDESELAYAIVNNAKGHILRAYCSEEVYENFVKVVRNTYPNLCIFNYSTKTES